MMGGCSRTRSPGSKSCAARWKRASTRPASSYSASVQRFLIQLYLSSPLSISYTAK